MKKGVRPGTENRTALLQWLLDRKTSLDDMSTIIHPLAGKSDEEKELIAAQILKDLKSKELQ